VANYLDRRLYDYLPTRLQSVIEYQALVLGEQPEIDALWGGTQTILANQFVETSTEYGVKRWEKILDIIPDNPDLETRKINILARLNEKLPFTIRRLSSILDNILGNDGYEIDLDANNYKLTVALSEDKISYMQAVSDLLIRIVPANIMTDVQIPTGDISLIKNKVIIAMSIIENTIDLMNAPFAIIDDTEEATMIIDGGAPGEDTSGWDIIDGNVNYIIGGD